VIEHDPALVHSYEVIRAVEEAVVVADGDDRLARGEQLRQQDIVVPAGALITPLLPAYDSGGGGNDGPNIDCTTATVPKFAAMTAWAKCTTCHSSTLASDARRGAPAGINYDNYADARTHAQQAMDQVYAGEMPLPGNPELTEEEKTQIYTWASCETPQ